jgi:chromosome partitioning protein
MRDKMTIYVDNGLTQLAIGKLAGGVSASTISRYIKSNKIQPLPQSSSRKLRYSVEDVERIIWNIYTKKFIPRRKVQTFYNFKGGTGKTSLCFQVSTHFALLGFKVLVIDADPQGHLSTSLGIRNDENHLTLFDVISGHATLEETVKPVFKGLDCIPANLSLTRLEVTLNQMAKREERVRIVLEPALSHYDFILFDSNPTISQLNRNLITFSNQLNVVCETQPYSLNGLKILFEDLDRFCESMQIKRPSINIIPNKYEDRTSSSAEAMTILREYYGEFMKADFAVRKSEDINSSAKNGLPLSFFAKNNSIAFEDIVDLIHYIIEQSCNVEK